MKVPRTRHSRDIVTGTSAGAVVGSLFASGMDAARLQHEAAALAQTDVVDLDFPAKALSRATTAKLD